jgi:hypothetical protein
MKNLFIATCATLLLTSTAHALTLFGEGIYKKSQDKESTRWTLSDWITQKKSFNAMDQWLAVNRTLDKFEFNIEGGKRTYDVTVGGNVLKEDITHYGATFYWSIFGLTYQFEDSSEDFTRESIQFNLRLLGASSQTTSLTAFYGIRTWKYENPASELKNNYAGAKLTLYLTSFFGIEGEYKKFFKESDAATNTTYESENAEYGVFVDLVFVRLYGQAFKEKSQSTPAGGPTTEVVRDGAVAGVRFYL